MNHVGRNAPCICGSGRKYKKCCIGKAELNIDPSSTAVLVDHANHRVVHFKNTMLANQLKRDIPQVENSFDKLCGGFLDDLSSAFSSASATIASGAICEAAQGDKAAETCASILANCLGTYSSAVHLLRSGFRLQPGMLLRGVIESASVAFAVRYDQQMHEALLAGTLKTGKAMTAATKAIPPMGPLYGLLSNRFVHTSVVHANPQSISRYTDMADDLRANLGMLRSVLWLLDVIAEAVFYRCSADHKYWAETAPGKLTYAPTDAEIAWLSEKF